MSVEKKYKEVMMDFEHVLSFPWENKDFYAQWLAQSYYYTSRSSRLLLMAAASCKMDQQPLHRRLTAHASEEKGHELIAEKDLKDLGFDLSKYPELPITTAFYATQFYNIQNNSVECFMGWVLPLEGLAYEYGEKIRNAVQRKDPKIKTRFLDIHIDEDPEHLKSAFAAINALPPDKQHLLLSNMELTKDLYLGMLEACERKPLGLRAKKAA